MRPIAVLVVLMACACAGPLKRVEYRISPPPCQGHAIVCGLDRDAPAGSCTYIEDGAVVRCDPHNQSLDGLGDYPLPYDNRDQHP